MENNFSTLRFIAAFFKVLAAITVFLTIIVVLISVFVDSFDFGWGNRLLAGGFATLIGGFVTIIFLSQAELILLFLQIEINTRSKQKETQWECSHCGHQQLAKFDFCPKCGLDDYGLSEIESRKKRLKREVEDEKYKEKIRLRN
jgi:hypothetical protein